MNIKEMTVQERLVFFQIQHTLFGQIEFEDTEQLKAKAEGIRQAVVIDMQNSIDSLDNWLEIIGSLEGGGWRA